MMNHATLTKEQISQLIKRLASDDAFRALFESKPASALVQLGVPAETVVELNPACLCGAPLAEKAHFEEAARKLDDAALMAFSDMQVPKMALRP